MKLALTLDWRVDHDLIFAQQLGADAVIVRCDDWSTVAAAANRVRQCCLDLGGIEVAFEFGVEHDAGSGPEEIDCFSQLIEDAGAAGIPLIVYSWQPKVPCRYAPAARGRAVTRVQQPAQATDAMAELWAPLAALLEATTLMAERAGVRLACRLAPPVSRSAALSQLGRAVGLSSSPAHGLDLDSSSLLADSSGASVASLPLDRIALVTLRNRRNIGEQDVDSFADEGDLDLLQLLRALGQTGYDGLVRCAPQPQMVSDTAYGHKGQAFGLGYVRALLQSLPAFNRA